MRQVVHLQSRSSNLSDDSTDMAALSMESDEVIED